MSYNNLPAGAEHDSNAPFNQSDVFCPGCQEDKIGNEVQHLVSEKFPDGDYTDDQYTEEYERFLETCRLCKHCIKMED